MRGIRKAVVMLTAVFVVVALAAPGAMAARVKTSVASAGPGAAAYVIWGGLAALISKESKTVEMSNLTTRGAVEDIRLVESGKAEFALGVATLLDLAIKGKLTADVIDKMGSDVISIGADVYEQVVMLTGTVETGKQKTQAGRLAKNVENVKKVYNEILVIKAIDKEKGSVENYVDDSVIETKINAQLLDAGGVSVTNYRYRSVGGRVFLFGRALSNAELKKAIGVVKGIDGVKNIKNRVFVRAK